jgi:hypothetical protein
MTIKPHAGTSEASLDSPTDVNGSSTFMTSWMMRGSRSYCDLPKSCRVIARLTQPARRRIASGVSSN